MPLLKLGISGDFSTPKLSRNAVDVLVSFFYVPNVGINAQG